MATVGVKWLNHDPRTPSSVHFVQRNKTGVSNFHYKNY